MRITAVASAASEALTSVLNFGEQLDDELWRRRTECPAWTVGQVYGHIAGMERWIAAGSQPFDGTTQDWIDAHVAERDSVSREAVLAELRGLIPLRHKQLSALPEEIYNPIMRRVVPIEMSMRMRVFDLFVHEQDVRRATNLPGGLASTGAAITRDVMLEALPRIVAKSGGSSVRFSITGATPADLTIVVGDDGRARATANPPGSPTVHLRLDWEAFSRLGAGRGARRDYEISITGDSELGERILDKINIAP